jgi:membrane-associated protein
VARAHSERFPDIGPATAAGPAPRHEKGRHGHPGTVDPPSAGGVPPGARRVSGVVDRLLGVPGWVVLLVVGLVVFAEDALFVGFVLPGETVAVLGGVAAKLGHAPLAGVLAVTVVAAVVGDSVGYEVGRHVGPRLLRIGPLRDRQEGIARAQSFLARRGGSAVFLGRWIALFRALMPAMAGASRMPYGKFLTYNALGGIAWGVAVVMLGYAAGASYSTIESRFGTGVAIVLAVLVVVGLVVWRVRRHLLSRREQHEPDAG